jgi:predicted MFS family arabinose efflux permease
MKVFTKYFAILVVVIELGVTAILLFSPGVSETRTIVSDTLALTLILLIVGVLGGVTCLLGSTANRRSGASTFFAILINLSCAVASIFLLENYPMSVAHAALAVFCFLRLRTFQNKT